MMINKDLCLIMFIVSAIMLGCGQRHDSSVTVLWTAKIDTVRVISGDRQKIFPGKLRAGTEANLSFRVSGRIERIPLSEGSFARKGTVVAELDARDYRVQLEAVEAEYEQVKATSERVIELYKRGSTTKDANDRAVSAVEQISAKLKHAKDQLSDTKLTAPFDGYIRKKLHEVGETVAAGMGVISMLGKGDLQVEVSLPVQDYASRKDIQRVEATVTSAPDIPLTLEPLETIPQGSGTQTYQMYFKIKNPQNVQIEAGMSAEVTVTYRTAQATVCMAPVTAVFEREGKSFVMIYKSETQPLEAQEITLGVVNRNGQVTVTSGLKGGEMIVVSGLKSIKEGMLVKPLPPVSPTNVGGVK